MRVGDKNKPEQSIRVIDREPLGYDAAHRVPDHDRALEAQGVQESQQIGREILDAKALRDSGIAVPPLSERDKALGRPRRREHRLEGPPGIRVAVQEHDRRRGAAALVHAWDRDTGRKRDGSGGSEHGAPRR
jgi:hypothetical protein